MFWSKSGHRRSSAVAHLVPINRIIGNSPESSFVRRIEKSREFALYVSLQPSAFSAIHATHKARPKSQMLGWLESWPTVANEEIQQNVRTNCFNNNFRTTANKGEREFGGRGEIRTHE